MSSSPANAHRFTTSPGRWHAGILVLASAGALLACEAPPDEVRDGREHEELAQVQEALVCREGALDASKTFTLLAPPTYADASVTFSPPLNFKLPTQIPVTRGNSGHGRVVLTFATPSGAVTCKYEGAHTLPFHVESELPAFPGNKYVFLSCSNGAVPGVSVTATSLDMHVKSSSFLAGTTKVHLSYVEQQPCGGGFDCGTAAIDDGDPCTADACDATTGVSHTPAPAGTTCGDADPCNGMETCNAIGACEAGAPPSLDDHNPCTVDTCSAVDGVAHTPAEGASCGAADACSGPKTCDAAGACVGATPTPVDDGNPCTADACDATAGVTHTPTPGAACSDGNPCHGSGTCVGFGGLAICAIGGPPTTDDGNPCTADACDPAVGVTHTPTPGVDCGAGRRRHSRGELRGRLVLGRRCLQRRGELRRRRGLHGGRHSHARRQQCLHDRHV